MQEPGDSGFISWYPSCLLVAKKRLDVVVDNRLSLRNEVAVSHSSAVGRSLLRHRNGKCFSKPLVPPSIDEQNASRKKQCARARVIAGWYPQILPLCINCGFLSPSTSKFPLHSKSEQRCNLHKHADSEGPANAKTMDYWKDDTSTAGR